VIPVPQTIKASQNPGAYGAKAVLLDIEGVICVGEDVLPGSLDAIRRIREFGVPHKFITNTTRRPRRQIVADLARLGVEVASEDVFTPSIGARDLLAAQNLSPLLVVHPNLREDFSGLPTREASAHGFDAVVVGDAGVFFTYDLLNRAYRILLEGAAFFALAKNRNFLDRDGQLSLDAGPFVAALEYGSRRTATVLGKPSAAFFKLAIESLGCPAGDVAMIGDDAEADVGGAMAAGLKGVLVRTGKYRPGQETHLAAPPTLIADDLKGAVEQLFG
jgi:HAD superfamily hydrolase (TIGR01458 family)